MDGILQKVIYVDIAAFREIISELKNFYDKEYCL